VREEKRREDREEKRFFRGAEEGLEINLSDFNG